MSYTNQLYGQGVAFIKKQKVKVQVAENNWMRWMCREEQENGRLVELREEIGMKKDVLRISDERLTRATN